MCTYGCIGVVANEVNYLLAISLAGGGGAYFMQIYSIMNLKSLGKFYITDHSTLQIPRIK